ncbi:MAG: type II toxin-antitoxin system CcdA family antitoxin [Candidatus Bathycorpusculaceae bacterium]
MNDLGLNLNSTWNFSFFPRGKHHNKTETKTTVSLYLSKNLVQKARKHGLNISRITEEALNSILSYMDSQNIEITSENSSLFLSRGSFQKESRVPRAGFGTGDTWRNLPQIPLFFCFWLDRCFLYLSSVLKFWSFFLF